MSKDSTARPAQSDINIEIAVVNDGTDVYVRFAGFGDYEEAKEYAQYLAETLPLLLFESTTIQ